MDRLRYFLIIGLLVLSVGTFAQDTGLQLTLTAEHDIGFDCPIASAAHPAESVLWVLMDNCYDGSYWLQAYDLITGEPHPETLIMLDAIDGAVYHVDSQVSPLAFRDETTLELIASDRESYQISRFAIDTATGAVTVDEVASAALNDTLLQYTEYVEFATYSPDHRYALASNDEASYLIDITTGELLKTFENSVTFAAYSAAMTQVFVTTFEDIDDTDNHNGLLSVYDLASLPDAEAVYTAVIPAVIVHPSPDGRYLGLRVGDSQLGVLALETSATTPLLEMWEAPRKVETCLNTGQDMRDVDFTVSGRLFLSSLQWLPDSSGFITLNSYGGEGAQGGTICLFNYSRLRQYSLSEG